MMARLHGDAKAMRDAAVVRAYQGEMPIGEICALFGLSQRRVQSITAEHGVHRPRGRPQVRPGATFEQRREYRYLQLKLGATMAREMMGWTA